MEIGFLITAAKCPQIGWRWGRAPSINAMRAQATHATGAPANTRPRRWPQTISHRRARRGSNHRQIRRGANCRQFCLAAPLDFGTAWTRCVGRRAGDWGANSTIAIGSRSGKRCPRRRGRWPTVTTREAKGRRAPSLSKRAGRDGWKAGGQGRPSIHLEEAGGEDRLDGRRVGALLATAVTTVRRQRPRQSRSLASRCARHNKGEGDDSSRKTRTVVSWTGRRSVFAISVPSRGVLTYTVSLLGDQRADGMAWPATSRPTWQLGAAEFDKATAPKACSRTPFSPAEEYRNCYFRFHLAAVIARRRADGRSSSHKGQTPMSNSLRSVAALSQFSTVARSRRIGLRQDDPRCCPASERERDLVPTGDDHQDRSHGVSVRGRAEGASDWMRAAMLSMQRPSGRFGLGERTRDRFATANADAPTRASGCDKRRLAIRGLVGRPGQFSGRQRGSLTWPKP